ncbi:hypothetical protein TNCV_1552111 [Trichonephila clavipes]|nr:hypothetical protein TNCV_1552111 [Trichonephila clavipes]
MSCLRKFGQDLLQEDEIFPTVQRTRQKGPQNSNPRLITYSSHKFVMISRVNNHMKKGMQLILRSPTSKCFASSQSSNAVGVGNQRAVGGITTTETKQMRFLVNGTVETTVPDACWNS